MSTTVKERTNRGKRYNRKQTYQLMALRDTYLNVMTRSTLNAKKYSVLERATAWWKVKDQLE
ncbi:unnamed protein product [Rhodiola kirilowii]